VGGVRGGHGEGLSFGLKEVLANRPATQEGKAGLGSGCASPESEDLGEASPISLVEVAEVVKKLSSGKVPDVDEIGPEMLKALDRLLWLTRLVNVAWRSGTVPVAWQTGVVVPIFKKGDRRVCSNYRGITLLRNVYSRVLERRLRPIVEPQLQEEQCGFRPSCGTVGQIFTLAGLLGGGMGVCPSSLHVLCGPGEGLWPCPPGNPVGGTTGVWVTGAVGTCHSVLVQVRAASVFSAQSQARSQCVLDSAKVTDSVRDLHGQNLKAQPR